MEISNYKLINKGCIIASFTVTMKELRGLIIRNCTLFCKDGRYWVNFPQKDIVDEQGNKKYIPYISFSKEEAQKINHELTEKARYYRIEEQKIVDKFKEDPLYAQEMEIPF